MKRSVLEYEPYINLRIFSDLPTEHSPAETLACVYINCDPQETTHYATVLAYKVGHRLYSCRQSYTTDGGGLGQRLCGVTYRAEGRRGLTRVVP
ncbi:hypothetical protein E2C01_047811 [Portunus trituberculatus]|uniref:Uncharacterized protein n=1 Tax=Portunus trituberculatus TaxID=210409 RepID=A0A5B7G9U9_PORTR|nr:hypothetical protein [Portunus trituberculatus]